jgi:heme/copper-type cytochrome/quinol oxidase subunit 2
VRAARKKLCGTISHLNHWWWVAGELHRGCGVTCGLVEQSAQQQKKTKKTRLYIVIAGMMVVMVVVPWFVACVLCAQRGKNNVAQVRI